jgi:hypothetical protein
MVNAFRAPGQLWTVRPAGDPAGAAPPVQEGPDLERQWSLRHVDQMDRPQLGPLSARTTLSLAAVRTAGYDDTQILEIVSMSH